MSNVLHRDWSAEMFAAYPELRPLSDYYRRFVLYPEIFKAPKVIQYGKKRKMPCIIIYGNGNSVFYYNKSFLELDFPEKISCYYAQNPLNIKKTLRRPSTLNLSLGTLPTYCRFPGNDYGIPKLNDKVGWNSGDFDIIFRYL